MKKNNFFLGLASGYFLFGRNKNKNDGNKEPGFFSTIITYIIWILLIYLAYKNGWNTIGTLLLVALILPFFIGIIKGAIENKKNKNEGEIEEMWALYKEEQYTLALEIAEKLANKNKDAATMCGFCYFNGNGCDKNQEKAFKYFESSKTNIEALAYYGYMQLYGIGCKQNIKIGHNSLLKASKEKEPFSCFRLGEAQVTGELISLNLKEGIRNLRVASDSSYYYADFLLGKMMLLGNEEMQQNEEEGLARINFAAKNGIEEAIEFLNNMNT